MYLPRPSVTPDAVRNSVSMFSLMTGARAGITFRNSGSEAMRQPAATGAPKHTAQINNIILINSSSPLGVSLECGALAPVCYSYRTHLPKRCQGTALQG